MANCKDCLHNEVCDQSSRQMWAMMAGKKECSDFKDRAKYAEVVHGEWLPVIDEYPQFLKMPILTGYKCSICGRYEAQEEPYCHCGAKMYGEKTDGTA